MIEHIAFVYKDNKHHLDTLVYAEYDEDCFTIKTSQRVGSLKYLITAYVISMYSKRFRCELHNILLEFVDGDKQLKNTYKDIRQSTCKPNERTLTDIIDHFADYFAKRKMFGKPSCLSREYVPDFEEMDDAHFKAWGEYFLSNGDENG